jgi:putative mRNA 3-end processing factor
VSPPRHHTGKKAGKKRAKKDPAGRLEVTYSPKYGGLHVRDTVLWLDGFPSEGLCFLSHGHLRVPGHPPKIVTTAHTAMLCGLKGRGVLLSPFDRPFSVGQLDLELFPSGHVPGGASLLLKFKGAELLYAGSVNPGSRSGFEQCQIRTCSRLILESRYGHPDYVFPDPETVLDELVDHAKKALKSGKTPVYYFSTHLGKPQALSARFHVEDIDVWAHRRIQDTARTVRDLGFAAGRPRRFKPRSYKTGAVFWLASAAGARSVSGLPNLVRAAVSGEALHPTFVAQGGYDRGFVLSDHADFESLVRYVKAVGAKQVLLLPGRAHALAQHLRQKHRVDAQVLRPAQMDLFRENGSSG